MGLFASGDLFDFDDFYSQLDELERLLDRLHGVDPTGDAYRHEPLPPECAAYTAALHAAREWAEDAELRVEAEDRARAEPSVYDPEPSPGRTRAAMDRAAAEARRIAEARGLDAMAEANLASDLAHGYLLSTPNEPSEGGDGDTEPG